MTTPRHLSLWARIWLALALPWKILFDGGLAARIRVLARSIDARPAHAPEISEPQAPQVRAPEVLEPEGPAGPDPTPALQLLSILQREGRFIDFLQEDVSSYSDAEVGAAARVVHAGCRAGLRSYVELQAVRSEAEGAPVTLEPGFDPTRTRLTGSVVGDPPYRGRLAHHGWVVTGIHLPTLTDGHDPTVVAPAEVELSSRT